MSGNKKRRPGMVDTVAHVSQTTVPLVVSEIRDAGMAEVTRGACSTSSSSSGTVPGSPTNPYDNDRKAISLVAGGVVPAPDGRRLIRGVPKKASARGATVAAPAGCFGAPPEAGMPGDDVLVWGQAHVGRADRVDAKGSLAEELPARPGTGCLREESGVSEPKEDATMR